MGEKQKTYDVIIVGAGIMGCMAARELSRYRLRVLVLEQALDIAEGTSKATNGVVHASVHNRPDLLKAKACAKGNAAYTDICRELDVDFKRIGSLYVATDPKGERKLSIKYDKVSKRDPSVRFLDAAELHALEPRISPKATGALYAPSTGILSPFHLIWALAQNAVKNGVEFRFGATVTVIERLRNGTFEVKTGKGDLYAARYVLNAAGNKAAAFDREYHAKAARAVPKRSQYLILDKQESDFIYHAIHRAGDSGDGDMLVSPTIDGNILVGPSSETVYDNTDVSTTYEGMAELHKAARGMIPGIDFTKTITAFAGVRENYENVEDEQKDFIVRLSEPGVVSILGVKNPGMTAAPVLVGMAVDLLAEDGLALAPDEAFDPGRKAYIPFMQCPPEEQAARLEHDPDFSQIICRCEHITKGDLAALLSEPLPPVTFDGFKKRLRLGMGRCHGAFCTSRFIECMMETQGCAPETLLKNKLRSQLVTGHLK